MSFAEGHYEPWACPACGREVPATFEICWNCGGDRQGESTIELARDDPPPRATVDDDPGPLYRRMHRRTALALVWAAGGWFAAMAGAMVLTTLLGPDGHRPWTKVALAVAGVTGVAFAIAVGSTLALLAFIVSPLWENYGPSPDHPQPRDDQQVSAGGAVTPEAMGFRTDREAWRDRR